ncbi:MAG TPA: LL-diaminopimelate aminotransferase [Spirochaetota bacterium]|nr:LL-diaminopimelate aminotransferase [Spirochaetota bacterium]HPQ52471.1 LL-diaminopimelate aminotransferase [Spirochaetota bacterium]
MESFIQNLFAERIGGKNYGKENKIYKFEKIKRAKREAMEKKPGVSLIDFGVGEPDEKAFDVVISALKKEADDSENRGYSDNGIVEFKNAAVTYMENVYGVRGLNPETEVIHAIGSKSALAMMPSAFINPGDVVLMTVPGYPVFGTHTAWYGGEVYNLPLKKENGFLPDLKSIPEDILKRAKVLVVNYPNNPTGAVADESFYLEVIEFARKNSIAVVVDAAYAALVYGRKPFSFLSLPGAKEVGVEIHSLSKAFNMTGWRLAFVVGNELMVRAFADVKDNYDSGQFKAVQKAGVAALQNPDITEKINIKYERRLKKLVALLQRLGFEVEMPGGTFYLYVKIPRGVKGGRKFENAEDFSQFLIKEMLISTVPWDDVEPNVRFSATFEASGIEDEERIMKEVETRLKEFEFEF